MGSDTSSPILCRLRPGASSGLWQDKRVSTRTADVCRDKANAVLGTQELPPPSAQLNTPLLPQGGSFSRKNSRHLDAHLVAWCHWHGHVCHPCHLHHGCVHEGRGATSWFICGHPPWSYYGWFTTDTKAFSPHKQFLKYLKSLDSSFISSQSLDGSVWKDAKSLRTPWQGCTEVHCKQRCPHEQRSITVYHSPSASTSTAAARMEMPSDCR